MEFSIEVPPWARRVVSDLTDMDRNPHKVDRDKVRQFTLSLPDDVYFEYAFLDEGGKMRPDPANEVRADNPWFPDASAVYGPDYEPDPYAAPSADAKGRTQRIRLESAALAQTRRLALYTPAGHEAAAMPIVFVQDGTAYYRIARLAEVLEALLAAAEIRPAHLVFIEPLDRAAEYGFNPSYRAFMTEELAPFVDDALATTGERIVMGASLGGLVSAALALHHPETFGSVVSQSGAFVGGPEELDFYTGKTSWVSEQLEAGRARGVRWYVETGRLEWLLNVNRRVRRALEAGGYDHAYGERNAGHNWVNWRNGLAAGLRFALAP